MSAPSRWSRSIGQPCAPVTKKYHPPRLIDDTWCMEVEDLHTREIEVRKFDREDAAWAVHTDLTQRQHWDKKRAMRGRTK